MNKLLNKTLLYYALSALMLLLVSAPVYYFLSQKLYLDDVDEAILLRENEFKTKSLPILNDGEINEWNEYNRDIHILPDTVTQVKGEIFQQTFFDTLGNEWEPYRILYSDINIEGEKHVLMIRQNLVESTDLIRTTGLLYLIIIVVMMVGFVIISRLLSQKLWKPFYQTLALIENFNLEQHQLPEFLKPTTAEFLQLNEALEQLIQQNLRAYRAQKEFTENAAHELQTPLSVFQTKLDLLIQDPSVTEHQAAIIQHLYSSVSRLSRLNKNLLLLAKMDNAQYPEKETLSLAGLIEQLLPYYVEQAQERNIALNNDLKDDILIDANRGLTEILVNNLLLNAIKHNVDGGSVSLLLNNGSLIISNSGSVNSRELRENDLFKRFAKASLNNRSTGLGLAIVKKITDINGWTIHYTYRDGLHHFTVVF